MKTIFALLLSTISFAQIQMPDTILLVDGRSAACLVTSIEDEKIYFNYRNRAESIVIPALKSLSIETFGTVYQEGNWENFDRNKINTFIENRLLKIAEQHKVNEELHRLSFAVSYTHLRAHETVLDLVCRLLLEKKNKQDKKYHTL